MAPSSTEAPTTGGLVDMSMNLPPQFYHLPDVHRMGLAAHLGLAVYGVVKDEEGIVPSKFAKVCRDVDPKLLCCTPTLQNPPTFRCSRLW